MTTPHALPADLARRALELAVVTETWPPEINGVALTLERAVDGLRARGHAVQLVRPRQRAGEQPAERPRLREVLVRGLPLPGYPGLKMGTPALGMLLRLWRERRPHLVHVATEGPLGWAALLAAHRLGLPVTSDFRTNFHAYSTHYGCGLLRAPIMASLRALHNRCAVTMVPTERLREELEDSGFQRLVAVARGVDVARFDPALRNEALRRQWGAAADTLVALYVGRLAQEKNLCAFVAAVKAMQRWRPGTLPVIVGDGPARCELQAALPRAVFAGVQRGPALAEHYASADAFVFPSLTETYGNVVPEAMASGLPVVAYDLAAAGELIAHGTNGLLARAGDEQAFIANVVRLASQPDEAARMGAEARETACAHGWPRIVAQLESVFLGAIAEQARGSARPDQLSEEAIEGAV